jgi:hypothetical protein
VGGALVAVGAAVGVAAGPHAASSSDVANRNDSPENRGLRMVSLLLSRVINGG